MGQTAASFYWAEICSLSNHSDRQFITKPLEHHILYPSPITISPTTN